MNIIINQIKNELVGILSNNDIDKVINIINKYLKNNETRDDQSNNMDLLKGFISAKRVEGCSEKSMKYYESTIRNMLDVINKKRT